MFIFPYHMCTDKGNVVVVKEIPFSSHLKCCRNNDV